MLFFPYNKLFYKQFKPVLRPISLYREKNSFYSHIYFLIFRYGPFSDFFHYVSIKKNTLHLKRNEFKYTRFATLTRRETNFQNISLQWYFTGLHWISRVMLTISRPLLALLHILVKTCCTVSNKPNRKSNQGVTNSLALNGQFQAV